MRKGEMRKAAIVDAARVLFFEKGYAGTTVQDILEHLGCSKGSFYHHFESKLQVLEALCQSLAEDSYAMYSREVYEDGLSALNGLIYHAMPFRSGEEQTLALLLPLEGLPDGSVVREALLDAQQALFLPELGKLLALLKGVGVLHYTQPLLPYLLWDTYTALYRHLMQEAARMYRGAASQGVLPWIVTERFLWERLTDAPYGTMELIRGDEAAQTVERAICLLGEIENRGGKT